MHRIVNYFLFILAALLGGVSVTSCKRESPSLLQDELEKSLKVHTEAFQLPGCVYEQIAAIEQEPVRNPPARLYRYNYQGKAVYYIPAYCCDAPSVLVDDKCNFLCNPDGGTLGSGDGQCPDFAAQRTGETLIWSDPRE